MSLHDDDFKVPRLNAENYHTWSIRTKAALIHKKCWSAIQPGYRLPMTENEKSTNEKALAFLFLVVDDNQLNDICECTSAKEAWEVLEHVHTKYGLLHILQLTRELYNINLRSDETVSDYLGRITQLHQKLKKCDYGLDDKRLALIMLLGLPKNYEALILHLEQREDTLTTKDVKSSLLVEEKRQTGRDRRTTLQEEVKALQTSENRPPKYTRGESRPRTNRHTDAVTRRVKCFCCGGFGHIARNCPNTGEQSRNEGRPNPKAKIVMTQEAHRALITNTICKPNSTVDIWFLDSGATDHMTCNKDNFVIFNQTSSIVETADKGKLEVKGKGMVTIITHKDNGGLTLDLQEVLYVPDLNGHLLSVGRIEERGRQINFSQGKAITKDESGEILLIAHRNNRLYEVKVKRAKAKTYKVQEENNLWHRRLGHLHNQPATIESCETCIQGKIKRKKFPKTATHRASQPLELIHSDVVGPVNPTSKGGSRWLATFIDDHTRYITVYFMKHKSEVLECFKNYQKEVERQLARKIKTIRSDNGREYINKEFDEYLEEQGITRQSTVPNCPQQNGVAERANQTLMDITRCFLIESGIPQTFWADALNTAAYIKNKHPSKATNNIPPKELWTGRRVERKHLRVYGCQTWSAIRYPRRTRKLDPKGEEGIFIGYPEGCKGYKIWDRHSGRIYVSRDTIFKENTFPCKDTERRIIADNPTYDEAPIQFGTEAKEERTEDTETLDYHADLSSPHPCTAERSLITTTMQEQEEKDTDPKTFKEAMNSPDAKKWKSAMEDELQSLNENQTWRLVPRPRGETVLGSKWVYKKKYNASGQLDKYKARLVARGFEQKWGINYTEVFAPVVKLKSLRLLIAIATERRWTIKQMDIKTAYLNGNLDETVYMERPKQEEPFKEDLVCLLQKSLYGLKQAGRQWNKKLDKFLKQWGLHQSRADPGIYYHPNGKMLMGVYVDDLLIATEHEEIYTKFFQDIDKEFGAKDLGDVNDLLSIKIKKLPDGAIQLSQRKHTQEILEKYNMQNAKGANTTLPQGIKLKRSDKPTKDKLPYRQAMGSLLYLSGSTRPDIAHTTSFLSQFSENPNKEHWNAVKHLCRYLQQTKDATLTYKPTGKTLQIYSDADWANDANDRKSYSGYVTVLAGGAISWNSRKQRTTALSTVEAEYIALCEAAKEATWLRHLLEEIHATEFLENSTTIHTDNQGTISLAQNKITSDRNKHIDLRHFYLREQIEKKELELKYIRTQDNPADILTKTLGANKINQHCQKLGIDQGITPHQEEVIKEIINQKYAEVDPQTLSNNNDNNLLQRVPSSSYIFSLLS